MEPIFFVQNLTGADLFRLRFLANRWHSEHVSGHLKLDNCTCSSELVSGVNTP